jgi:hypothetical protein
MIDQVDLMVRTIHIVDSVLNDEASSTTSPIGRLN